tara:strand:+ start:942 stop:1655 length:714 start_codon:yes stop_codon:yes gene_type:complete
MIDNNKWTESIPKINLNNDQVKNQIDSDKWINTIPKKSKYISLKKYSFITILFIFGLISVSVVKNETRNLERDINILQASIKKIKFDLSQAILDNEVITSPENVSKLAKEYLNSDFITYKKSQIRSLDENYTNSKIEEKITYNKKIKNLPRNVKHKVAEKIEQKKQEIEKLKKIYNNPKSLPSEVRIQVVREIKEKKSELEEIYKTPKQTLTFERVGKWGAIQVVKAFLGIPIVPGR